MTSGPSERRRRLNWSRLQSFGPIGMDRFDLGQVDPYWQRSRLWWVERSLREQILLAALSVALILAALLLLVIAPLRAERADALARIRVAALLEARLRAGEGNPVARARIQRGTASAILTDSASAARLTIDRIEPEGGGTRVVIADAPFDQVLRWIADLEATSRLRVSQSSIVRKSPGIVSTTLVIAG